jgi:predicted DNA-binding transcriptional regulator AlpA
MKLLTIEELAAWLGMTVDAVKQRRYRDPSSLPPAIRIGNSVRYDPETVRAWLKEREEAPPEGEAPCETPIRVDAQER